MKTRVENTLDEIKGWGEAKGERGEEEIRGTTRTFIIITGSSQGDVTQSKHISRLPAPSRDSPPLTLSLSLSLPLACSGTDSITVNEIRDRSLRHNLKHLIPRSRSELRGTKGVGSSFHRAENIPSATVPRASFIMRRRILIFFFFSFRRCFKRFDLSKRDREGGIYCAS